MWVLCPKCWRFRARVKQQNISDPRLIFLGTSNSKKLGDFNVWHNSGVLQELWWCCPELQLTAACSTLELRCRLLIAVRTAASGSTLWLVCRSVGYLSSAGFILPAHKEVQTLFQQVVHFSISNLKIRFVASQFELLSHSKHKMSQLLSQPQTQPVNWQVHCVVSTAHIKITF